MTQVVIKKNVRPMLTRYNFISGLYVMDECGDVYITSHDDRDTPFLVRLSLGERLRFNDLPPVAATFYILEKGTVLEITV